MGLSEAMDFQDLFLLSQATLQRAIEDVNFA